MGLMIYMWWIENGCICIRCGRLRKSRCRKGWDDNLSWSWSENRFAGVVDVEEWMIEKRGKGFKRTLFLEKGLLFDMYGMGEFLKEKANDKRGRWVGKKSFDF